LLDNPATPFRFATLAPPPDAAFIMLQLLIAQAASPATPPIAAPPAIPPAEQAKLDALQNVRR
jgi:hypothetical protein